MWFKDTKDNQMQALFCKIPHFSGMGLVDMWKITEMEEHVF